MLWQRALRCPSAPSSAGDGGADRGTVARDGLFYSLATALADLFPLRGGDELAAAALLILFDRRFAAWYGATAAEASQPPRVAAAANRVLVVLLLCPCGSLGVSARFDGPPARPP